MANCEICQRGSLKGHFVSHSQIKTIRRQKLNLQNRRVDGKKMTICTSCMKNLVKQKTK